MKFKKKQKLLSILLLVVMISTIFALPFNIMNVSAVTTSTQVDIDELTIQNNILSGISENERIRLWEEAQNHNTPITLDLSATNITEIADNAINETPIMRVILPSTIVKIGENALAKNLIHQVVFLDNKPTDVAANAFTQLSSERQAGIGSGAVDDYLGPNGTVEIEKFTQIAGRKIYRSTSPDFQFYYRIPNQNGELVPMRNPYYMVVLDSQTGELKEPPVFGTFRSMHTNYTDNQTSSATVNLGENVIVLPTKDPVKVSDETPTYYNISSGNINITGAGYVPFNLVKYVDVSPVAIDKKEPKGVVEFLSVGLVAQDPLNHRALHEKGWEAVDLHTLYGEDEAWGIEQYEKIVEKVGSFDSVPSAVEFTRHLSKENYDVVTIAKPREITYRFYDIHDSKSLIGDDIKIKTYEGFKMPNPVVPKGYELSVKDYFRDTDVSGSFGDNNIFYIPVNKKVATSSVATPAVATIQFVNEDGIRLGENFIIKGVEGEKIELPTLAKEFLTKHSFELLNPDIDEVFSDKEIIKLIIKGHNVGPKGEKGDKGDKGDTGSSGSSGFYGSSGSSGTYSTKTIKKIVNEEISKIDFNKSKDDKQNKEQENVSKIDIPKIEKKETKINNNIPVIQNSKINIDKPKSNIDNKKINKDYVNNAENKVSSTKEEKNEDVYDKYKEYVDDKIEKAIQEYINKQSNVKVVESKCPGIHIFKLSWWRCWWWVWFPTLIVTIIGIILHNKNKDEIEELKEEIEILKNKLSE